MSNIISIPLGNIRIDGGTQSRVSINTDAVADYAEAMTAGESLPPVLVFFDGAAYWLADGFHRLHANRKIGAASLAAEVREGTLQDAKLYAYGANKGHGLRRSNDDKRKAVLGMLADFGAWSDNKIAKHVGVDHKTVAVHRASILGNSQDAPAVRTVERAGKTYQQDTSKIGKAAPKLVPPKPEPKKTAQEIERDRLAEEAFGDTDPLAELEQAHAEIRTLTAEVAALSADDAKAETLKWRRMYDSAQRGQSEAMDKVQREMKRHETTHRWLMRCGKSVGETDPEKIAAAVEAFARQYRKAA